MPASLPENGRGPAPGRTDPHEQCRVQATTAAEIAHAPRAPHPGFAHPDALVIVRSAGPRLAKRHERQVDGTIHSEAYEDAAHFSASATQSESIEALARFLERLSGDPRRAVIRAAPRASADPRHMRRKLHDDRDGPGTLVELPRRWAALDFDGLDAADGWWLDLAGTYERLVRPVLPVECHKAACVMQASGSAGIKPGLRCRVWFLLTSALVGAELRRVFGSTPGLDRSTLYPATLTYTARPVFVGMADSVPVRTVVVPGEVERVAVRVPPEPPRPPAAPLRAPIDGTWGPKPAYARAALEHACQRIKDAGDKQQHPTLFREAAGIGALVGSGHMPLMKARADLIDAGLSMKPYGRPWRHEEVSRQVDRGLAAGMDRPRVPGGAR